MNDNFETTIKLVNTKKSHVGYKILIYRIIRCAGDVFKSHKGLYLL